MSPMSIDELRRMVLAALLSALTAAGAYIQIPIGPVPMVLSTLFVLLSGLLLGSRGGLVSMGLYLLMGAMGVPVFAGGKGGFAHFFDPTGGYLFGYALSAWVTGFISERVRPGSVLEMTGIAVGILAVYSTGLPWLKMVTHLSWAKTMMVGMIPFLIGDGIKGAAAFMLARSVRPMLHRQRTAL